MRNRMPVVAAASALLLGLTACVPTAEIVVPVEPSHAQPVFASDEEALAAAVEVYQGYTDASNQIRADGGDGAARISAYVTHEQLEIEMNAFTSLQDEGTRFIGSVKYSNPELQQWWQDGSDVAHVIAYFCADSSELQIVKAGAEPEPVDVSARVMFEVKFVSEEAFSPHLLIEGVEAWQSSGGC